MEDYVPFDREATLQELMAAWQLPYHVLYKSTRVLKIRAKRGDRNTMLLTVAQQHALAEAIASTRVVRPVRLDHLNADEQRAAFAQLHGELDRLTHSYERLSQESEINAGLAQTYKEHLDWLAPIAEERLGRIEAILALSDSPDFATSLKAVKTLAHPIETPLADVQDAALFTAAIAGIFSRRFEADAPAYDRLVEAMTLQPLGMLRGQLTGHLFGLGATLQAALDAYESRQGEDTPDIRRLEALLITVMGQLKIWANDSLGWLGERVHPLTEEAAEAEVSASSTTT